jgi:hypothetical protein
LLGNVDYKNAFNFYWPLKTDDKLSSASNLEIININNQNLIELYVFFPTYTTSNVLYHNVVLLSNLNDRFFNQNPLVSLLMIYLFPQLW